MGKLRPEDLVKKPVKTVKGNSEDGDEKKIPPKFVLIGGGIALLILAVVMMWPSKNNVTASPVDKKAAIEKGKAEILAVQNKKDGVTPGAPAAPGPASPEQIAQLESEIAKADSALKSISQQVAIIDTELHEYSQAAERLGQVGDRDGKREADHQISVLTQKRKELASSHEKWVAYRSNLAEQKGPSPGESK